MLSLLFRAFALFVWYLAAKAAYYSYYDQKSGAFLGWCVVIVLLSAGAAMWKGSEVGSDAR